MLEWEIREFGNAIWGGLDEVELTTNPYMMNNDEIREDFLTWSGGFPPESEAQIFIYVEAAMPIEADPIAVGDFLRAWMVDPDARSRMDG